MARPQSADATPSPQPQRHLRSGSRKAVAAGLGGIAVACVWGTLAAAAPTGPVEVDPDEAGKTTHLVLMVVYACVALGFSFLCSVAEAVLLSVSPSYIGMLKQEPKKKSTATLLESVKNNIDRSLAAILTLNTIAHTIGAGGAGAEAAAYFNGKYVGASMAVLTLLILFLSEIIPKTIGAVFWRPLAPWTARFVKLLTVVLYPFIFVSELLTRMLTSGSHGPTFSREELSAMADIGAQKGQLNVKESRILRNLFRFPDLTVHDIMTPRTVMFALQQDLTAREALDAKKGIKNFSRIPIYGKHHDDITGFVLKDEVLMQEYRGVGEAKLVDLKRDLQHVSESTPLSEALEMLLNNRQHVMLVVDTYGGTEGIVTLEDIVETLIGSEIVDEMDAIDDMRMLARKKWEERMAKAGIDIHLPPPTQEVVESTGETAPDDDVDQDSSDDPTDAADETA